jgi:3-oxoacyl-(acyl-carrier-protein) synthase
MTATISSWATWTSGGVSLKGKPAGAAKGVLGAWADAPPLSKVHPRARRPHTSAKQLVQLASAVLGDRRPEGLGLVMGSMSGCAAPDREFQQELETKGWGFGGPSLFVYTLPTAALGEVSIAMAATGPLLTMSAGLASGLSAVTRGLEWVAQGRCERVLCGSYELAGNDEHIALFLVEAGASRAVKGASGFGELPPSGGADALSLAAALSDRAAASLTSRDERGFWASVSLGEAP